MIYCGCTKYIPVLVFQVNSSTRGMEVVGFQDVPPAMTKLSHSLQQLGLFFVREWTVVMEILWKERGREGGRKDYWYPIHTYSDVLLTLPAFSFSLSGSLPPLILLVWVVLCTDPFTACCCFLPLLVECIWIFSAWKYKYMCLAYQPLYQPIY